MLRCPAGSLYLKFLVSAHVVPACEIILRELRLPGADQDSLLVSAAAQTDSAETRSFAPPLAPSALTLKIPSR